MKIEEIYDFTEGTAASFLKRERQLDFSSEAQQLEMVEGLPFSAKKMTTLSNGMTVLDEDGKLSMLFWYKRQTSPRFWQRKLQSYHVMNCRTMKTFGGYSAANAMPVEVIFNGKKSKENLPLCINCKDEVYKHRSYLRRWRMDGAWHNVILELAEQTPISAQIYNSNGYLSLWDQLSEAYRSSIEWRCENPSCRVDLSLPKNRKFLHTHHLRGTKNNRREDLEALCLLCHAMEHEEKMINGGGTFDVEAFIGQFRKELDLGKVRRFEEVLGARNKRFVAKPL